MRWTSAVSLKDDLEQAVTEACAQVASALEGEHPDLLVAFVSHQHGPAYDRVPSLLRCLMVEHRSP